MHHKKVLICDLDNTLYDWVGYFVLSFYAMVDCVVKITGCDREDLLDDFRKVHQESGDSEEPFALLKTDTIKSMYEGRSAGAVIRALDPAFHAFNSSRRRYLKLHPDVRETLDSLRKSGIKLIAHTESKLYAVVDRLSRLELSEYFDKIYCRERSSSPYPIPGGNQDWLGRFPMNKVVELSHHQRKPDPTVLLEICVDEGIAAGEAAYIGDSVARDVLMAKRAGVFAIWAAYGAKHSSELYRSLVRISHWTPEEVAREQRLNSKAKMVEPDYVAQTSFAEVLEIV